MRKNENPNLTKPSNVQRPKSETLEILKALEGSCRDCRDSQGLEVYAQLLADIPTEALMAAIVRHLAESETPWFPAIGLLRRYAAEHINGVTPDWDEAWETIMKAVAHWSQHDKQRADEAWSMVADELGDYVKSLGGFYVLANCSSDELTVKQSHFRNAWTKRKEQAGAMQKLPENLRPKTRLPEPVHKHLESFGEIDR